MVEMSASGVAATVVAGVAVKAGALSVLKSSRKMRGVIAVGKATRRTVLRGALMLALGMNSMKNITSFRQRPNGLTW